VLAEEIEAFKDRIKAVVRRDDRSSRVYQFTLTLFPVSADVQDIGEHRKRGAS
jgi:hypothetical protein